MPRPPSTAADDIASEIAPVRAGLGPEAFDRARTLGRTTPLADAVARVLGAVPSGAAEALGG